ncbi:hypothetical protein D9757_012307 [Collybiopsis confluens]|uniref:Uncharacterized protein n=1 Tax=Collybiopsis confluens TaxID=2823264 RepID=A0A8H5LIL8_9AGAR|nr:hypothetical protein D9757_012307 [Collybiopsis confluens]
MHQKISAFFSTFDSSSPGRVGHDVLYQNLVSHMELLETDPKAANAKRPMSSFVVEWFYLIYNATNADQIQRTVNLVPQWKAFSQGDKDGLNEAWADALTTRTAAKGVCFPNIPFQIYSDPSKYGIPLSLRSARRLVHDLKKRGVKERKQELVTALSLYEKHDLPHFTQDIVTLSLVLAMLPAIYQTSVKVAQQPTFGQSLWVDPKSIAPEHLRGAAAKDRTSKEMYDKLLLSLKQLIWNLEPEFYTHEAAQSFKAISPQERTWLSESLQVIDNRLRQSDRPEDVRWLTIWRLRAGMVKKTGRRSLISSLNVNPVAHTLNLGPYHCTTVIRCNSS